VEDTGNMTTISSMAETLQKAAAKDDYRQSSVGSLKLPSMVAAISGMQALQLEKTLSPVAQNGSYAFDKVLKNGTLLKRTRKTKVSEPAATLESR
jgi:hypothetical protein